MYSDILDIYIRQCISSKINHKRTVGNFQHKHKHVHSITEITNATKPHKFHHASKSTRMQTRTHCLAIPDPQQ